MVCRTRPSRPRTSLECEARRHGTASAYTEVRCRCPEAREAWRLYNKRRREGRNPPRTVCAVGPSRRLQALVASGWTWVALAREAGYASRTVKDVGYRRRAMVHVDTYAWVAALYDRLSLTAGGSAYALTVARRYGWAPPLAWDDDQIDDPAARPWTGLGEEVVDWVAIDRALRGRRVALTRAERHHAVHEGVRRRMTVQAVADALRVSHRTASTWLARPLPVSSDFFRRARGVRRMTTTVDPPADRIDAPDLAGFTRYYGVQVREVRDGDGYVSALVALGHPPARTVLAAFNAHARSGDWHLADDLPATPLASQLRRLWAVVERGEVPIFDGLAVQPIRWDASPLDAGSFPVTVLEPGPHIPATPEETA